MLGRGDGSLRGIGVSGSEYNGVLALGVPNVVDCIEGGEVQSFQRLYQLLAQSLWHRRSRLACVCAYVHVVCVYMCVCKVAAPEWEFEQINFVVFNRGSVVESNFYTKLKKLDIQKGKKRQALRRSCDTGMRSAHSGDCVLPSAGARRYKANYRGIEGGHWA